MPKGLTASSSVVSIGFQTLESAPNTLTQSSVDLNLSPLDREVFVVLAINMDPYFPDGLPGVDTSVNAALTTTSQSTLPEISNSNCLAKATHYIAGANYVDTGVGFTQAALETPPSTLDFIGIIATNDFFVQVKGVGNLVAKGINGKLYGYRARADASIYSALVQSEVLSA